VITGRMGIMVALPRCGSVDRDDRWCRRSVGSGAEEDGNRPFVAMLVADIRAFVRGLQQ
jgi:hypothetical protein